jgi:hypothetical protein
MITHRKLEIFKKFNGDIDHLARVGSPLDKMDISDKDWSLIDSFLQDLELVEKGLAADSFKQDLNSRLKDNLESETILQELKRIIKK